MRLFHPHFVLALLLLLFPVQPGLAASSSLGAVADAPHLRVELLAPGDKLYSSVDSAQGNQRQSDAISRTSPPAARLADGFRLRE